MKAPHRSDAPGSRLAWAFVAETRDEVADPRTLPLLPVTAYAHLRPRERPAAFCPCCLEPVVLRLGTRNRHHYGHRPEAVCAAARGEGALHLAAKIHLAEQLKAGGASLRLERLCARVPEERSRERCARSAPILLDFTWDQVRLEYTIPSIRADLILLSQGREVAALEVCASHRVDLEKASAFARLGLPWVEVPAREIVPESGIAWSRAGRPLPALQDWLIHPAMWRCPRHMALHEGRAEYALNGTHRLAGRVVHIYRSDGGRSTGEPRVRASAVFMMERREQGRMVEAWLERDDREGRLGLPIRTADPAQARRFLHRQFLGWIRWMRDRQSCIVDSPMRWVAPEAIREWRKTPVAYPERLRWDAYRLAFGAAPNAPSLAWPRLAASAGDAADPVVGYRWCAWTQRSAGRPPLICVLVDGVWLTLSVQRESDAPDAGSVGQAAAFVHDGSRWRDVPGAPFVLHRRWPAADSMPWTRELLRIAGALAPLPVATLLDDPAVATRIVREAAAATIEGAAAS